MFCPGSPGARACSQATPQASQSLQAEKAATGGTSAAASLGPECEDGPTTTAKRRGRYAGVPEAPAAVRGAEAGAGAGADGSQGLAQALHVLGLMVKGVSAVGERWSSPRFALWVLGLGFRV